MRSRHALLAIVGPALAVAAPANAAGLASPREKDTAMRLVSSAENSSLDWRAHYRYIEGIRDGRGYTAGIIGFCSGTGDMLELVRDYTRAGPRNPLRRFLPALRRVNGSASHAGLGRRFVKAWRRAANTRAFRRAQDRERVVEMRKEAAHEDVSRIETAQRRFLREGNLTLARPLRWAVYGDEYGLR